MIGTIPYKNGKPQLSPSSYSPTTEVREFTARIKDDYKIGDEIMHKSFAEFDDNSPLTIAERDQKRFNIYVGPQSQDPDEKWRFHGMRPTTRNKVIQMAARVVSSMLYPEVFAQNDASKEDKDAAMVMRDLIEWNIRNSDYEMTWVYNIIAMMVNPVAYISVDFVESMQKVKERLENGKIKTREVIDELVSGLQCNNTPMDEILIANAYEHDLQKQRFIIRKRFIEFEEAKARYGEHENWHAIKPGVRVLFSETDGLFYEQYDDELQTLVEEVIYYNRLEDLEVPFVNGVYLGDTEVNANPMKHRRSVLTKKGEVVEVPVYPYAKGGFEPIDEKRFYFYKSLVSKMWWDDQLLNRMWQLTMDGTFLSVIPPIGITGEEAIGSSVMIPGSQNVFENENTKIFPITAGINPGAGYAAMQKAEQALAEDSQDNILGGQLPGTKQTATATRLAQQNAMVQMGLFGRMYGSMVKQVGYLMVDVIIHHQTIASVDELSSKMKYNTFIMPNTNQNGKRVTKRIEFTDEMFGEEEVSPEKKLAMESKVLQEEGGIKGETRIYKVNPEKFARLRFQIYIEPDQMEIKSKELEKAMKLEAYTLLVQNPLIMANPDNLEAVTRDFLVEPLTKESEKYLQKPKPMQEQLPPAGNTQRSNLPQQIQGNNSLSRLVNAETPR